MKYSLWYKISFAMYLVGITILACCAVKNTAYSIFAATVTGFIIWNIFKSSKACPEAEDVYHFDAEDAAKGICTAEEVGTFTTKEDLAERCKKAIATDADRYYNGSYRF